MMRLLALALIPLAASAGGIDVYDFKMKLAVPRIYDNSHSLGQRKWQTQIIRGQMLVDYNTDDMAPVITFENCINQTHVVNGKHVTYMCEDGYDEAVDPTDKGRTYTETDEPVPSGVL